MVIPLFVRGGDIINLLRLLFAIYIDGFVLNLSVVAIVGCVFQAAFYYATDTMLLAHFICCADENAFHISNNENS